MKNLLLPRHRATLARFVGSREAPRRVLLAFDYDGVLAPLVKQPSGAWMRPPTHALLRRVVALYPVAIVSGRSWRDASRFVGRLGAIVVGNHGFELGRPVPVPPAVVRQVRGWRERLERELRSVDGVHFEDKRSTLAVHYGLGRNWRRAERAVYEAANQLEGTRLVAGKKVLNVLPHDFPSKGDAVRTLVARLRCDAAMVLGDDVTDEDAFAVGAPLVFGVHVGAGPSLAPWRLATQLDVDRLLRVLVDLRGARGERGGGRTRLPRPPGGPRARGAASRRARVSSERGVRGGARARPGSPLARRRTR
jgi:trehalose 6-phosphate phosphatase